MLDKIIILIIIQTTFLQAQFSNIEISLDLRNISKNHHILIQDLKSEIENYYENTIFSNEDKELGIPLKIHVVIESLSNKNNMKTINAQFFISNNLDLNIYSKSSSFPYYKGRSMMHSEEYDPLASLLDYFAYIYIGNELDMYSTLGGSIFLNKAEKKSVEGRESDYANGWDDRWKKCKKIIENEHLRKLRFYWYEIIYFANQSDRQKYLKNRNTSLKNNKKVSEKKLTKWEEKLKELEQIK